jgi:ribosomal subunit interface protein
VELPLEITFRNVEKTEHLDDLIRNQADQLEKFHPHITSCRMAIEQPQKHQRSGNPYRVRLEVHVPPGHHLVVTSEPKHHDLHDTLDRVLTDTFQAMERQLKELARRQRMDVKQHDVSAAFVIRLFKEAGYGFIKTPEGREIYFQRAATLHNDWDRLEIGTQVRFEEAMGEMGPQATTVHIIDKPGHRVPDDELEAVDVPQGWRKREQ